MEMCSANMTLAQMPAWHLRIPGCVISVKLNPQKVLAALGHAYNTQCSNNCWTQLFLTMFRSVCADLSLVKM